MDDVGFKSGVGFSRRRFNSLLSSFGLAFVTAPIFGGEAKAEEKLSVLDWSGYEVPALHSEYVAKYGNSPDITLFADDEEAYQKVKGGVKADLVHPTSYAVGRYREQGMLKPIDTARLSHWKELFPALSQVPGMSTEGQQWFAPCGWGILSVLYRSDLVDIKEESWSLLWDERYKGKISSIAEMDGSVIPAAVKLGIANPFAMTDDEINRVKEALIAQRSLLRFYWTDPTQLEQAMAAGEVVASFAWMASHANLKKQKVPVKYMQPKEGVLGFIDGFVMLKNSAVEEQRAYDFIDAWLSPESGKYMIENLGYAHSNRKGFEIANPDSAAALGITSPDELVKSTVFLQEIQPQTRDKLVSMFEEVKAGL